MDVTDVLRDRMREPAGFERMAVVSVAVHVVLLGLALFAPGGWFGAAAPQARSVMTISLGGSRGPQTGGMNQIGGRPVQEVRPADAPPRPEPVRPPAARAPEMTAPAPNAPRRAPNASSTVTQAPPGASGRTPTRGAQVQAGSAVAETGARGQGTGLSSGGGTGGDGVQLDVAEFCCPDYLRQMVDRIRANWNDRQGITGTVVVRFTIQRNGALSDVSVFEPSRFEVLNLNAQTAVVRTRQIAPLPLEFPNPSLTIRLTFDYQP
jgi:TonB family protein